MRLLQAWKEELKSIDMVINKKISNCMHIGSRHDKCVLR